MNIICAGGFVAKAKGLSVDFGDIDIFLGPSVLKRIREMKRINKELDGLDFGRLRLIPPRREDYAQEKVLSVHNIDYDGIRTKVQFIGREETVQRGRVTSDLNMLEFAESVMDSFDFDIVRHSIVDGKYQSYPGGLDLIETHFNHDLAWQLEALSTIPNFTDKLVLVNETLERAERYVRRLNVNHFVQFTKPLKKMTKAEYEEVKIKYNFNPGPWTWTRGDMDIDVFPDVYPNTMTYADHTS